MEGIGTEVSVRGSSVAPDLAPAEERVANQLTERFRNICTPV